MRGEGRGGDGRGEEDHCRWEGIGRESVQGQGVEGWLGRAGQGDGVVRDVPWMRPRGWKGEEGR